MESRRLTLLLGEVNDRIFDLLEVAGPELPVEFLCECGRGCERRVKLAPAAFVALRRGGRPVRSPECRRRRLRRSAGRRARRDDSVPATG